MQNTFLLTMPGSSEWIFILLFFAFIFVWGKAIVEIGKGNFSNEADKTYWLLLVIFLPLLGVIIYNFSHLKKKESKISNIFNKNITTIKMIVKNNIT